MKYIALLLCVAALAAAQDYYSDSEYNSGIETTTVDDFDTFIRCFDSTYNSSVPAQRCLIHLTVDAYDCACHVDKLEGSPDNVKKSIRAQRPSTGVTLGVYKPGMRDRVNRHGGGKYDIQCYGDKCSEDVSVAQYIWSRGRPNNLKHCDAQVVVCIGEGIEDVIAGNPPNPAPPLVVTQSSPSPPETTTSYPGTGPTETTPEPTEPITDPTGPTETTPEPTEPITDPTGPTETTPEPTEPITDPTGPTETTPEPTEPITDPTGPTETTPEPTEPITDPTSTAPPPTTSVTPPATVTPPVDNCAECVKLFSTILAKLKIEPVCESTDFDCLEKNLETINQLLSQVEAYLTTGGNPCNLERYRLIQQALENRKFALQKATDAQLQKLVLYRAKMTAILSALDESDDRDDYQIAEARRQIRAILAETDDSVTAPPPTTTTTAATTMDWFDFTTNGFYWPEFEDY